MKRWGWLVVALMTFAVWAPTIGYGWLTSWDDGGMWLWNPFIRTWASAWGFMVSTTLWGHWMPLTWLSATATYALWGYNAAAWHGVNVVLHTISAVLFYLIARRLVGSAGGAVLAALVFAVHPLRMESVAWITERKDVLMGVFFLGAALLWLQGRRRWALVAFLAACLSKELAVVLPVMLLCYEWWRHRPCCGGVPLVVWRRLAPFVAVSALISVNAFYALHQGLGNALTFAAVPIWPHRLLHVAWSEVFYAMQTVWPARLSHLIEYTWIPSWDQPQYPIAVGAVLVGAVVLVLTRRRRPALTAAAVAYAVAVFPQAGLFQNGPQLVANRYSYLACLPLALLVGGAVTWGLRRSPRLSLSLSAAVVMALAVTTSLTLPMWRTPDTLWAYAAQHEPTCTLCLDQVARAEYLRGDLAGARRHIEQAIAVSDRTILPRWERHWNLAGVLLQEGNRADAMRELRIYLAVTPPALLQVEPDRGHYARAQSFLTALEAGSL